MPIEVLDPTFGDGTEPFTAATRLDRLEGTVIGIVSNGKQGTGRFFEALAGELIDQFGVAEVVRTTKGNYSAPAEHAIMDRAQRWNALISGIGD